jgi:hypothetical protein
VQRFILLTTFLAAGVLPGAAQDPPADDEREASGCAVPVLVPPHHWAVGAARRVAADGTFEVGTTATGSLPLSSARQALEAAAEARAGSAIGNAAALYLARLAREYPYTVRGGADGCGPAVDGRVDVGYAGARGFQEPGFGYEPDAWTGPVPVPSASSPAASLELTGVAGPVGLRVDARASETGLRAEDLHLALALPDVVLWAGRRQFRYGPGGAGGIVWSGEKAITGVGAVVTDPIHLPWILGALGPVGMESFFSRARGGEGVVDPWLWGARITATPHPRFRIGASRGTLYGGEGNTPVTAKHLLQMLAGMHSGEAGEFDNHFGSLDLRYRPPWVPLDLYLEWGMHDSAGAWWDMPARMAGVSVPALPFAPAVGLGVEFVHFPGRCCGNPMWYRNWAIRMGWTHDGGVLGHPVGGHGNEWSLRADAVAAAGVLVVNGRVFRRVRGDENLFAPDWVGVSAGADVTVHLQAGPGPGALLRGYFEEGSGWRASRLFAGATWTFGG